jgi:hypothetical protein
MDSRWLEPGEVRDLLMRLSKETPDLILVGGQAVNFWSVRYYEDNEQWNALRPFTSEDIDFLGSRQDAQSIGTVLEGKVFINQTFDASPNAGVVLVKHNGKQLRIDVLANVFGINAQEIVDLAIDFIGTQELEGIKLKVIDPLLALESKLECLFGLPQEVRQDLKHTHLCVKVLDAFLRENCQILPDRVLLGIIERVFKVAMKENGLRAWRQYGIEIEQGIPLDMLETSGFKKIQRFNEIRKPQLIEYLQLKRQQHKAKIERRG